MSNRTTSAILRYSMHFTIYMYLYLYSYRRETARQLRMYAQLTRCFCAVAELLVNCYSVDVCDGFNLLQPGEHGFQFLDVTSSVAPDSSHQDISGAAHYYAPLPQPQPVYLFIDQSGGFYPALTSASVGAGTALASSAYVAPVAPMMPPQMQSAGVMLPPGLMPAAAQTRSILAPTLLRPGMLQQPPPAPGVIMPAGLMPAPPAGMLPPPTSIMAAHGPMLPLPHSVSQVPLPAVNELPFNATSTLAGDYSQLPVVADANGLDSRSVPVDMSASVKSPQHESVYTSSVGCNVNNSAAEQTVHPDCDGVVPDCQQTSAEHVAAVDTEHGDSSSPTYESCSGTEAGVQFVEQSTGVTAEQSPGISGYTAAAAAVNGELSVDASHDLASSSESSSVASPSSMVAEVSLNDHTCDGAVPVSTDSSNCHAVPPQSSSAPAVVSPSTAVKTKAPSWASLLKDTTSATNAIVININDNHAAATQQKTDTKSTIKESVTQQSPVSHVSNGEKLKLEVSGLYVLILCRVKFTTIF